MLQRTLSKTECSVAQELDVSWWVCPGVPVQTRTWTIRRCCKKSRNNPKRLRKITRNFSSASVARGHNTEWEWFLLTGDWQNWCRFWPYQIGIMKCIASASRLRPVPLLLLRIWPYGKGECAGQGRRQNSHTSYLSILAFWMTLMKIVLTLQGKEQVDEATLIQQNENRDISLVFCVVITNDRSDLSWTAVMGRSAEPKIGLDSMSAQANNAAGTCQWPCHSCSCKLGA